MEQAVTLGVWAVTVIAPCIMSWLAGDMVGSARTRRMFKERGPASEANLRQGASDAGYPAVYPAETSCAGAWQLGEHSRLATAGQGRHATIPGGSAWQTAPFGYAPASASAAASAPAPPLSYEAQADEAERRRLRRAALARMTPSERQLDHLAQAEGRDRAPWPSDAVASAAEELVLFHYRQSIIAMRQGIGRPESQTDRAYTRPFT